MGREISSHPDIVYPEKLYMFGCLRYGSCCVGGEDVDRANTVVRIKIMVRGWDLSMTHSPLRGAPDYLSISGLRENFAEDKSACLEVWCFSKLSGEGKHLQQDL